MANVNVNSQTWTQIGITSGTVQNISATAYIELSAEQTDNSGVVLKPSEIYQWDNETIYARAVTEETGALRVVNFKKAAGGGGGYVLPVATASKLGGVKVGSNLNIDENGILSGTAVSGGQNYSTTEQLVGTWIDGKPLYQITVESTTPASSAEGNVGSLPVNSLCVGFSVFVVDSSGIMISLNNYITPSNYCYCYVAQSGEIAVKCYDASMQNRPCTITLQYTKTTD